MERRFNDETVMPLLKSISVCHPDSKLFLDTDTLQPLIEAYKLKGAGSYLAGMAVAIPILNGDGRSHTKNNSKDLDVN